MANRMLENMTVAWIALALAGATALLVLSDSAMASALPPTAQCRENIEASIPG